MANTTQPTDADVTDFLDGIPDPARRADAHELCLLMGDVTGEPPTMWGDSIVGFGQQHYRYSSGREGDWFLVGFAPRKTSLTVYLGNDLSERADELARLGRHRTGAGCVYLRRLTDVDAGVLRELVGTTVASARQRDGE